MAAPEHYDPRLGDESAYNSEDEDERGRRAAPPPSNRSSRLGPRHRGRSESRRHEKHVRLNVEPLGGVNGTTNSERVVDSAGADVDADLERGPVNNGSAINGRRRCKECTTEPENVGKEKSKSTTGSDSSDNEERPSFRARVQHALLVAAQKIPFADTLNLNWVSNNLNWSKIKPALRTALVAWVSMLFVIIPELSVMLGQVSFVLYCDC